MTTDGLSIAITADGLQASHELKIIEARLAALEVAYNGSASSADLHAAATTRVGEAAASATVPIRGLKGELASLGASEELVSKHAATLAKGFQAAGLSAAGAASRVAGLAGALEELKGAAPQLLLMAAGFTAVASAYEFVKSAIGQAAQWQQAMMLLGQTVKDQGGNWAVLSSQVEAWANLQESTTTFSRDQAVSALKLLTATGMSLSDAMKSVRVAEDASAASGKSLTTVVHGIMEAEHGRTQVLAALGIGTREQIKLGMTYHQILQAIEKNMGGAATTAAETLAGSWKQLGNVFNKFASDVGTQFLPQLTAIIQAVKNIVEEVDAHLPEIEADFVAFGNAIKKVWSIIVDATPVIETLFAVVIGVKAVAAVRALQMLLSDGLANAMLTIIAESGAMTTAYETLGSVFTVGLIPTIDALIASLGALFTAENLATLGIAGAIALAVMGIVDVFHHWSTVVDTLKYKLGEFVDSVANFIQDIAGWIPGVDTFTSHIRAMGDAMQQSAVQAEMMHHAIAGDKPDMAAASSGSWGSANSASTDTQFNSFVGGPIGGTKAKGSHAHNAAVDAQKELNSEIQKSLAFLKDEQSLNRLTTQQNIDGLRRVEGEYKLTMAQRASIDHQIAQLQKKQSAEHIQDMQKSLDALKQHDDALIAEAKNTDGQHSKLYIAALNAEIKELTVWLAANKNATQKMIDDVKVKISEFEKIIRDKTVWEEKQAADITKKYHQEQVKQLDQLSQFSDRAVNYLDAFFKKGKKGTNDLASAFQDMVHSMEQALEKSALMSLLGSLFGVATPGFGALLAANFTGSMGGSSGGSSGGIMGALFGGGANAPSTVPTGLGNALLISTGNSASGGGLSGMLGGSLGGELGMVGMGLAGSMAIGSLMGSAMHDSPGNHNAQIGSVLGAGAGLAGALALGLGTGAMGGLGALGLGMLGPAGWAVLLGGALLGGAAGGLIGDHTQPATSPDIYDSTNFGKAGANLMGSGLNGVSADTVNGTQYTESASAAKKLGGEGELAYIGQYIARVGVAQATKDLGASAVQMFQGLTSNTTSNITNLHQGIWTLANGQQGNWQAIADAANNAVNAINGLGSAATAAAIPIYDVTHSFPDWQNPQIALGGNYTPGAPSSGGGVGTGGGPTSPEPGGGLTGGGIIPGGTIRGGGPFPGGGFPGGGFPGGGFPGGVHVQIDAINVGGLVGMTHEDLAASLSETVAQNLARNAQLTLMRG